MVEAILCCDRQTEAVLHASEVELVGRSNTAQQRNEEFMGIFQLHPSQQAYQNEILYGFTSTNLFVSFWLLAFGLDQQTRENNSQQAIFWKYF